MRRLVPTAAAMLLLATGCVVGVDEGGVDPPEAVAIETQGDMGFDPDDCGIKGMMPEQQLLDDFGILDQARETYDNATEPPVFRQADEIMTPADAATYHYDMIDPNTVTLSNLCETHGICNFQPIDTSKSFDMASSQTMTFADLCETQGICQWMDVPAGTFARATPNANGYMTFEDLCETHGICKWNKIPEWLP